MDNDTDTGNLQFVRNVSSFDRLRQQELRVDLDCAASANRLDDYLQAAERAIQNNTVQAARTYMDRADGELNTLEAFLGK